MGTIMEFKPAIILTNRKAFLMTCFGIASTKDVLLNTSRNEINKTKC